MGGQRLGLLNKSQKQQLTNKEFLQRIEHAFNDWRRKRGKPATMKSTLEFLLRHNFMHQCIINRWVCLDEYAAQIELTKNERNKHKGNKQIAIWAVEELVPLGETQIKANVSNHVAYFKENRLKFP